MKWGRAVLEAVVIVVVALAAYNLGIWRQQGRDEPPAVDPAFMQPYFATFTIPPQRSHNADIEAGPLFNESLQMELAFNRPESEATTVNGRRYPNVWQFRLRQDATLPYFRPSQDKSIGPKFSGTVFGYHGYRPNLERDPPDAIFEFSQGKLIAVITNRYQLSLDHGRIRQITERGGRVGQSMIEALRTFDPQGNILSSTTYNSGFSGENQNSLWGDTTRFYNSQGRWVGEVDRALDGNFGAIQYLAPGTRHCQYFDKNGMPSAVEYLHLSTK